MDQSVALGDRRCAGLPADIMPARQVRMRLGVI
jgi:hypothetical protein